MTFPYDSTSWSESLPIEGVPGPTDLVGTYLFCPVQEIDLLIIDAGAPEEAVAEFVNRGVEGRRVSIVTVEDDAAREKRLHSTTSETMPS